MPIIKITPDIEQEIIKDSLLLTKKEISTKYSICYSSVRNIFTKNKIDNPDHVKMKNYLSIDFEYFKNIDSHEKSYWLGYLAADGSINKKHNKVILSSKDKEIIEKFKKATNSSHKIGYREYFDKRPNKNKIYSINTISITNTLFVKNLVNLGIDNNKSYKFSFPNINIKYYSSFLAGLFDGDGCITNSRGKKNQKVLKIKFLSTKELLIPLQNLFLENLNISITKLEEKNKQMNLWELTITRKSAINVLDFIYKDIPDIYLSRKFNLYKEWKKKME